MTGKRVYKIEGIPTIHQFPDLPTGCEATALTMLLNWGDLSVTKFDVVDKLPKGEKVHQQGGKWYGANPNKQFVGDPYSDSDDGSFGVFEQPILATIEKLAPGKGVDLAGKEFDELLEIVKLGKPVMAWTTIEQRETYLSESWLDEEGNQIDWYCNEHAVVIVGFSELEVVIHDPYTGKEETIDLELFKRNWKSMNKRAVTLKTE